MTDKLEKKIFDRFSHFFKHKEDQSISRMGHGEGFTCGDGWFDILLDMIIKIDSLRPPKDFEIVQVKEKFAELRVYVQECGDVYEEIIGLIHEARKQCAKTCELCGSTEKVTVQDYKNYWLRNMCARCYVKNLLKT